MRLLAASTAAITAGVLTGTTWSLWPTILFAAAFAWFLHEIIREWDAIRTLDEPTGIPDPYRRERDR